MRVLWFTLTASCYQPVRETCKRSPYTGGGWISSAEKALKTYSDDIELGVGFMMDNQPRKVVQDGVTYYPVPNPPKIVLDDLGTLWNYPMAGKPIAAVPDPFNNEVCHYNMLRYPQKFGYFNAGVLMINLKYWREHDILSDFLKVIEQYPKRLTSHDQDVLNLVFKENKIILPLKYNVMPAYLQKLCYNPIAWEFEEEIKEAQAHPIIIHFTSIPKPWCSDCINPYTPEFDKYFKMTVWKKYRKRRGWTARVHITILIKKLIVKLGMKPEEWVDEYKFERRD